MEWMCTRCGCNSYHYNHSRMRNECDGCGHPVVDRQQDEQQMQFDRTYMQACRHLSAGNWNETVTLLQPLINQNPTDIRLYLVILKAATQNFTDIEMRNQQMKSAASNAWNKLVILNGINGELMRYSRRRHEKHIEELIKQRNIIIICIFVAANCIFASGICALNNSYFMAFVLLCLTVVCMYNLCNLDSVSVVRQLNSDRPNYQDNPF